MLLLFLSYKGHVPFFPDKDRDNSWLETVNLAQTPFSQRPPCIKIIIVEVYVSFTATWGKKIHLTHEVTLVNAIMFK